VIWQEIEEVRFKEDSPGRLLGPVSGKSLSLSDRDILNLLSFVSVSVTISYMFLSYFSIRISIKHTREFLYTARCMIVNLFHGCDCSTTGNTGNLTDFVLPRAPRGSV
jgi:hypothetical protein